MHPAQSCAPAPVSGAPACSLPPSSAGLLPGRSVSGHRAALRFRTQQHAAHTRQHWALSRAGSVTPWRSTTRSCIIAAQPHMSKQAPSAAAASTFLHTYSHSWAVWVCSPSLRLQRTGLQLLGEVQEVGCPARVPNHQEVGHRGAARKAARSHSGIRHEECNLLAGVGAPHAHSAVLSPGGQQRSVRGEGHPVHLVLMPGQHQLARHGAGHVPHHHVPAGHDHRQQGCTLRRPHQGGGAGGQGQGRHGGAVYHAAHTRGVVVGAGGQQGLIWAEGRHDHCIRVALHHRQHAATRHVPHARCRVLADGHRPAAAAVQVHGVDAAAMHLAVPPLHQLAHTLA
mmetsp:Transcript_33288/g.73611  ORF Transcript_33288/g.73611 Transcript_33288/m.73611 type:complete len:340 (+) Transcript_33288:408-1427(+)